MRRASWGRGGLLVVALLLGLSPGRAAAELPMLSLPATGYRPWHLDLLVGTRHLGVGMFDGSRPFWGSGGWALEVKKGDRNGALDLDVALHQQLTDMVENSSCSAPDDMAVLPQPFNVATQVGLHGHTATRTNDTAGFGPAAGLSMSWNTFSPRVERLEGFTGVQLGAIVTPARARLGIPLRVSAGIQLTPASLHLLLVGRAGWDDLRRDLDDWPVYDITLAVGFGRLD